MISTLVGDSIVYFYHIYLIKSMERVTGIPSTRRSTPRSGQASHPLPLHSKSTSWAQAHLLNLCGAGGWRLLQLDMSYISFSQDFIIPKDRSKGFA